MTKKIISLSLCLMILTVTVLAPKQAQAATMDSYAGAVTTSGGSLNVRSSASASSTVSASLKKGSHITLISQTGDWWKVEYAKGKYGYCHAAYITPIEGKPATVSATVSMHDRYWAENLADFYELVRNSGEMDLKNQPEWQNSAFIFDGEIVSQDALGNINYGYFGKHCNFPDSVLIAAGGVAQFLAGTSEFENWYVFLDDPRDTYRVMQGIEIYEEDN